MKGLYLPPARRLLNMQRMLQAEADVVIQEIEDIRETLAHTSDRSAQERYYQDRLDQLYGRRDYLAWEITDLSRALASQDKFDE